MTISMHYSEVIMRVMCISKAMGTYLSCIRYSIEVNVACVVSLRSFEELLIAIREHTSEQSKPGNSDSTGQGVVATRPLQLKNLGSQQWVR